MSAFLAELLRPDDHLPFEKVDDESEGVARQCAPDQARVGEIAPGIGTFFDEYVDMLDPEGAAFTARVLELFYAARPMQRRRGHEVWAIRVRRLLANAMRVHFFRDVPAVLYFRGKSLAWDAENPAWMRHGALGVVVDGLVQAGLFRGIAGKKMPHWSNLRSYASSYAATDELIRIAADCGVTSKSIERRIPADQLVRLFGPKPKHEFGLSDRGLVDARKGKRIAFAPTPETERWTAALKPINASYGAQEIALRLSPAELVTWLADRNADPDRTGASYRIPEMFQTTLYRVFNDGEEANPAFERGGRLFGGWWMSIPSELRKAITINGQPTSEIDYANCHPRMLYHERGLDPDGDLYTLPEIAEYEISTAAAPGTYRPYIKWLMQVLINCRGRPKQAVKPDHLAMPPVFSSGQMIGFVEARHQPIVEAFKSGSGMRLMRQEADIALEIVSTATAEGWTALSIHDSFIAPVDKADRLKTMMVESYVKRFGWKPVLK